MDLEADLSAKRLGSAPAIVAFRKPADHLGDAEPALHLELGIGSGARAIDRGARHVGTEDVDRPALPFERLVSEQHRQRIWLLTGRAARRPNFEILLGRPCLGQCRKKLTRQQVKRLAVAKEIGLVVQQCLHDQISKRRLAPHHEYGDQLVERRDSARLEQGGQRGLDPPAAAHRQLLPGARFE